MALIVVNGFDTFAIQKDKINQIATYQGDLVLLTTPVTTDLVSAINSLSDAVYEDLRSVLIRAIAMS